MKAAARCLVWLLALALLHAVAITPLPFTSRMPADEVTRLSPDLFALLGVSVLGAALGRPRWFAHLAAVLLLAAVLFRTADCYLGLLLERRLDLSQDVLELPGLLHLLTHDSAVPPWAGVVIAVLGLVIVELALAWAFARVARPARRIGGAVAMAVGMQAVLLAGLARVSCDRDAAPRWHATALVPLAAQAWDAADYWLNREAIEAPMRAQLEVVADGMRALPGDLGRLEGADVHVLVIESYGRFALREPTIGPALRERWREWQVRLREAGFAACTTAMRPSVSGGGSWLSHAQLLTGAVISHGRAFRLMLESSIAPLPKRFRDAGYRTVEVMPAMHRHWPEGQAFYGFDDAITQEELAYTGETYHWGRMPDQFALHYLLDRVVRTAQRPLFTMFISVTSHVPFQKVPPYVADWRIGPGTFAVPPQLVHPVGWLDVPQSPKLVTAYGDTIEYALRCAVDFTTRLTRPSLVFVFGDHQPPIANVGSFRDPGFDVPLHVFANQPQLLEPLRSMGFLDGCDLPDDAPSFDSVEFAPSLLRLYAKR